MKRSKRMKAWTGWCVVERKSGDPWYIEVCHDRRDAQSSHIMADDGNRRTTRIARVVVREVSREAARGKGSKR